MPTETPLPTATNTPTATAVPVAFEDGFESGNLVNWTTSSGVSVQSQVVYSGSFAARATSGGAGVFAQRTLSTAQGDLYYRVRFRIVDKSTIAYLIRFRTAANGDILGVNVSSTGKLSTYNRTLGVTTTSSIVVTNGVWHELQVHANQGAGAVEVWYDGALVPQLSFAQTLGASQIGRIELGDPSSGRTFDIAFDDVRLDTAPIPSSFQPVPPPTATPTATATNAQSATPVPTSTPTLPPAPTSTPPPTEIPTSTPEPPTNTPEPPTETAAPIATDTPTPGAAP